MPKKITSRKCGSPYPAFVWAFRARPSFDAYAAFVALLDTPPQPNERLRKSLQTLAVWE
jgi:hypothetical protein